MPQKKPQWSHAELIELPCVAMMNVPRTQGQSMSLQMRSVSCGFQAHVHQNNDRTEVLQDCRSSGITKVNRLKIRKLVHEEPDKRKERNLGVVLLSLKKATSCPRVNT